MPPISISRCFSESAEVYRRHFFVFLFAGLVVNVLGLVTFSVLWGVLQAGMFLMILEAMRGREEIQLGDVFRFIREERIWRMFVIFWGSLLIMMVGFICLIIPGLIFGAWLLYPLILAGDQDMTFGEAIAESKRTVGASGLWRHVLLWVIVIILSLVGGLIGGGPSGGLVSFLVGIFLEPFTSGLIASAYYQIYDEGAFPHSL
jgi:uncharacterized membrane protein